MLSYFFSRRSIKQANKYWRMNYRFDGKQRTLAIGIYPEVSLAEAREHCADARKALEGLGLVFVANHFDVVPVRTNDESCIVVRVVVRAQTGRTIVFATRLQSRTIERFDLLASIGHER